MKSRSGRLIKPKKFFEDTQKEEKRRLRKRPGKCLPEWSEESPAVSRRKCSRTSTQCAQCEEELPSHSALFRHLLLSHLPPEVVKTLPVYAEGETGWCQNCQEPLPVSLAEQHMAEKHPELVPQSAFLPEVPTSLPLSQSAVSPARSLSSEGPENQSVNAGNLTEQSERLLEQVDRVLEDEEEEELKFCADMGREMMAGLEVVPPPPSQEEDREQKLGKN